MALPKIATPKYVLTIPSTGKEITYRPFLVNEEKILLMAMESGETKDVVRALSQIIENCTESKVDVSKLSTFDLEYIFVQLRSKSIGSVIELKAKMTCDDESCPKTIPFEIDLNEIDITRNDEHTSKIKLTDTDGIVMKYPTFDLLSKMNDTRNVDAMYDVIVQCIDYIYDANATYSAKDSSKAELTEYINSLTHQQFEKVSSFFDTMPKVQKVAIITCPKCGKKEELVVSGLDNFFA